MRMKMKAVRKKRRCRTQAMTEGAMAAVRRVDHQSVQEGRKEVMVLRRRGRWVSAGWLLEELRDVPCDHDPLSTCGP